MFSSSSVILADISTTGAAVFGRRLPRHLDDAWLKVGIVNALATVAWRAGNFCGLTFDAALTADEVENVRREGRSLMLGGITPDEKRQIEEWQKTHAPARNIINERARHP